MRAITAEIDGTIRAHAAEDVRIMVASGKQTGLSMRPADDRVLTAGDMVMLYVAAEVQRYWAEGARTFVLGTASDAMRDLAARCSGALASMRDAIRPGVAAQTLAQAADRALGDEKLRTAARAYGYGNGIGLDAEEAPMIAPDCSDAIANNAALALQMIGPAQGMGIAIGETILVRDGNVERLIDTPDLVECRF
jgi:Xaa-Pro aminopeptidase